MSEEKKQKELTGRHVLMITVSAFGLIIAVNIFMATQAVGTFPGLEVKNSYVASQKFDARRTAQESLGWTVTPSYQGGLVTLDFTDAEGRPISPETLKVLIGRTTVANQDIRPKFTGRRGVYTAPVALDGGKWMMVVEATSADGTEFRQRLEIHVKG